MFDNHRQPEHPEAPTQRVAVEGISHGEAPCREDRKRQPDRGSSKRPAKPVKVLIVGQTPPPYHGQAIMIERLLRSHTNSTRLYHVRMQFSDSIDEIGKFAWAKITHLIWVIGRIFYYRLFHGVKILYYPPAGPNRVRRWKPGGSNSDEGAPCLGV